MKASELRIGNLLEFSNGIQPTKTVTVGRRFFSSASIETEDGDFEITCYYKPIPLTEEWLEKFGFEKHQNNVFTLGRFEVHFVSSSFYFRSYNIVRVNFVHELQNAFYIQKRLELTIKN